VSDKNTPPPIIKRRINCISSKNTNYHLALCQVQGNFCCIDTNHIPLGIIAQCWTLGELFHDRGCAATCSNSQWVPRTVEYFACQTIYDNQCNGCISELEHHALAVEGMAPSHRENYPSWRVSVSGPLFFTTNQSGRSARMLASKTGSKLFPFA
jgi:hypothetical protein